jgi:predicted HicB family RNase H-like nuclease
MIDDLVTFEATNVAELESNFKNSVNDYIQTCV